MPHTRILLVEDDRDHQRLLSAALLHAEPGMELTVVSSREELLEAMARERFDGVVTDFNLAPAEAPQILQEAEALLADTPVVVVSSIEAQSVVIESLRTGVADFVPKERAICDGVLWNRLESAIRARRLKRIEMRKTQRRLENLDRAANQDPLTGLGNRRRASRLLNSERNRKDRRLTTSLVLFDLDHFKQINDKYGHAAGDRVLVRVAEILSGHSLPSDAAIRWGGEEFLVIKGSASSEKAWLWAEEVLTHIRQLEFEGGSEKFSVTASVGIATLEARCLCEDSIRLADRPLYLAKDLGRDRVCTEEMAGIYAAALEFQCRTRDQRRSIAAELIRAVRQIGPTQREHVGMHSELVQDMALRLGRLLGLGTEDMEYLESASRLHDVGKLAVPESLLAKPGPLTREERQLVDSHARFGGEICTAMGLEKPIAMAVKNHHRRFDSILPSEGGRAGGSLISSILNVADSFVAMTSDRAYARRRTRGEALAELQRERGLQFDPQVVDTLVQASCATASG